MRQCDKELSEIAAKFGMKYTRYSDERKLILGLTIEGAEPGLTKEFKDRLRQRLYFLEKLGPVDHAFNRKFDSIWGMKAHIKGLIDFAKMIEPKYAALCRERFDKIDWPV